MSRRLDVTISVNGRPVAASVPAPPRQARLDQVLPALRALDDAAVAQAARSEESRGRTISCAKGCSACCEAQPVPVTPPEAYALARLVERQPPARRAGLRAAFAAAAARLRDAGLAKVFLDPPDDLSREDARGVAIGYLALRIPCPFLADRACSIYAERPFVCRQYLVTSPPDLCADPLNAPVAPVPMPLRFASAMLASTERALGTPQRTVPLVLALAYTERRQAELSRRHDAETIVRDVLDGLARQ